MYYTNAAGRRYLMPELPLEPPDCWVPFDDNNDECLSAEPFNKGWHSAVSEEVNQDDR